MVEHSNAVWGECCSFSLFSCRAAWSLARRQKNSSATSIGGQPRGASNEGENQRREGKVWRRAATEARARTREFTMRDVTQRTFSSALPPFPFCKSSALRFAGRTHSCSPEQRGRHLLSTQRQSRRAGNSRRRSNGRVKEKTSWKTGRVRRRAKTESQRADISPISTRDEENARETESERDAFEMFAHFTRDGHTTGIEPQEKKRNIIANSCRSTPPPLTHFLALFFPPVHSPSQFFFPSSGEPKKTLKRCVSSGGNGASGAGRSAGRVGPGFPVFSSALLAADFFPHRHANFLTAGSHNTVSHPLRTQFFLTASNRKGVQEGKRQRDAAVKV